MQYENKAELGVGKEPLRQMFKMCEFCSLFSEGRGLIVIKFSADSDAAVKGQIDTQIFNYMEKVALWFLVTSSA